MLIKKIKTINNKLNKFVYFTKTVIMDHLLFLHNKVYDFNTESIRDKQPSEILELVWDVEYDPNATSETFDKFLDDFTLGRKDIKYCLQEFFGMSLMGDSSIIFKKFLNLYGDGSNGKTVVLNIMSTLMGTYSISRTSDLNNYDILNDKRLLVLFENDESVNSFNNFFIKQLIGGDLIYSNPLRRNFKHSCRLVTVSNKKEFETDSNMKNRCIYVPCLMNAVSNPTEPHQRKMDIYLFNKLNTPQVLSAMLNWLIEGALRFKRQGYVTEPTL